MITRGGFLMLCDCHLHTNFSGDSQTIPELQIERAIALGMKEMCITDHHDYDSGFCEENFVLNIEEYLSALRQLKEEYRGKIRINLGIELGLQNHLEEYLKLFSREYGSAFDFIIGSSHFVEKCDPYYPEYWEKQGESEGFSAFFEVSMNRVFKFSDCFDSFGHLDYVVRYAPHKEEQYSYQKYSRWIDPILEQLIRSGKALECNSGGLKYGLSEPNPCADIFKRYKELGGELITIGSDAHTPQYVGYGFEQCREMLLSCGFRYYAVFHNRKPVMLPLLP
jgi:histidinol-phosphatase (PHP family)